MLRRAKLVPLPLQECVACGWGWAQEGRAEGPQSLVCCGKPREEEGQTVMEAGLA